MKFFLPPNFSSEGHFHLSLQNLLLEINLPVLFEGLSFDQIHLHWIMCVRAFLFIYLLLLLLWNTSDGVGIVYKSDNMSVYVSERGGWSM